MTKDLPALPIQARVPGTPAAENAIIPPKAGMPFSLLCMMLAAVAAHLALYQLPLINMEWAFADAARYFATHQQVFLDRYFAMQANTLGVPLLAWLIHQLIPFVDVGLVPRLIAASGFIFLGVALLRFNRLLGGFINPHLLLAVAFLNPIIWTFGGRGTADFFPAALCLFSLSLFWDRETSNWQLCAALLVFGVAILLKYHAVLLLPLVVLERLGRRDQDLGRRLSETALITAGVLVLPGIYVIVAMHTFGFWLSPAAFHNTHALGLAPAFVVTNFVSYGGYLALLLAPFSIFAVWNRLGTLRAMATTGAIAIILFLVGFCLLEPPPEMTFGPLDAFLNSGVMSGMFLVSAGMMVAVLQDGIAFLKSDRAAHRYALCLAAGILVFIGVLSCTRPAQRYLLFVLPVLFLFVPDILRTRKIATWATLGFYVAINVFITLSQIATGNAATELTEKIVAQGLLADTNPGVIVGHTGNLFPADGLTDPGPKKYTVVAGTSPRQLFFAESHPAPFIRKIYALVPTDDGAP
jgi:hypothetical protein